MPNCQRTMTLPRLLLVLLFWCGCAWSSHADTPYVVLFVLDGTGRDVLDAAVARGEVPTMQRLFYEQGMRFTDATTNFPSATSPNYPAMIAGLYPGHLGAPYLAWFDRTDSTYRDFVTPGGRARLHASVHNWYAEHAAPDAARVRTLFDLLAPLRTAAIYVPYTAGASVGIPRFGFEAAWELFVRKRPEGLNRAAFRLLRKTFAAPAEQLPHFTMVGLFATDGLGHHHGTDSPRVRAALHRADQQLAAFIAQLTARGIMERTYLIVTSDHGMHDIRGIVPLTDQLRGLGLRVNTGAPSPDDHAVIAARGIASATISLRAPGQPWNAPFDAHTLAAYPLDATADAPRIPLLNWLRTHRDLDTVLVRETPRAVNTRVTAIYRGTAHGVMQSLQRSGRQYYSYRPLHGDPLGLRDTPAAALATGQPHTAAQWNRALAATPFPASVPQLAHIFDDGHAGDIVVVAANDLGFFHDKAATHGTYQAIDMRVPLLIYGPGVPHAVRNTAQIVDLAPTIAQWFDRTFPERMDGNPLLRNEHAAAPITTHDHETIRIHKPSRRF